MTPRRPGSRYIGSKRSPNPPPPPLPKEATPTGPREYVDRFGAQLVVVWSGADGSLANLRRAE